MEIEIKQEKKKRQSKESKELAKDGGGGYIRRELLFLPLRGL